MDWKQLWEIAAAPDNIPIVALIPLLALFIFLAWRQARANDLLIAQLAGDSALAKTHHRKAWPFQPGWQKEVHVWPFLLRVEFLAAIIVTIILMVWSITLNAPLEEPANPNLTMNPAKAPWYFLGLQEMLVYFDPWIAGVVMPTLIIIGLMVIPYIDTNPMGSGYYTWKQRRFAISTFLFGFIILWVTMIIIGTFIRGPGWQWFWPGQTWDHNRLIYEVNRDLPDIFGITSNLGKGIFGAIIVGGYFALGGFAVFSLFRHYMPKDFARMSLLQFAITQAFLLIMLLLMVTLLWALWDEAFGMRPWKAYQHVWKERYTAFLKTARSKSAASQKDVEASPDYQKLKQNLDQATQQSTPHIRDLQKQIGDLNAKVLAVQSVFTDRRAYVNALTYQIETASSASSKQSIQKDLDGYKAGTATVEYPDGSRKSYNFSQLEETYNDLKDQRAKLNAELGDTLKPVTQAKTALDDYVANHMVDLTPAQIGGLEKKVDELNPTIQQVNVAEANIVDRCESCHLGIREPVTLTPAVMSSKGAKTPDEYARAFVSHSEPTLLQTHDPDKFGCSPCHQGNGRATTSIEKAHGN